MQTPAQAFEPQTMRQGAFSQRLDQSLLRTTRVGAQSIDMALVMPLLDKRRQRQLIKRADRVRIETQLRIESLGQRFGKNQIGNALPRLFANEFR